MTDKKHKLKARLYWIFYHTRKWTWFASLASVVFLVVAYGVAQYWLPTLFADKARVERYLGELSKQNISIGQIKTAWDGIFPGVRATDVEIRDPVSRTGGIRLKEASFSLSYMSVLKRQPILHRVVLVEPNLEVLRSRDGKVTVIGIRAGDGSPSDAQPTNTVAMNWLLAQGLIEIRRGKFAWDDKKHAGAGRLEFANVNLSLQNDGDRHKLDFSADFPRDICGSCSFSVDIEGNPLETDDWGGYIDINAIDLNLRNRLSLLAKQFPAGLDGKVDMVLRSQWVSGRPRLAIGRVTASDIDVPLGRFGKSLTVNKMIASLKWRGRNANWSLDMDLPFVRVNQQTWLPGQLKVSRYLDGTSVYLKHLDIGKAVKVAGRFNIPDSPRQFIARLNPSGSIDDLRVDLKDKLENQEGDRLQISGSLREINTRPYRKIPGVRGLSATVDTSESSGEIFINSRRAEFTATQVFRESIPIHRAKARVTWQLTNNVVEVNTQNIQMVGGDLSVRGGFVFKLPLDRSESPHLDLRAEVFNGVVARKSVYLPVNIMKPGLVRWLDQSIISGKVTDGHVIYRGKTREFPFLHDNGLFEVLANVDHGKLQYLPGWQPVSNADMTLLFRGQSMVITGSAGKIDQLDVNEIVARKDNLKDRQEPIRITGRVTGPVGNTLSVLRRAVANGQKGAWTRFVESDVRGSGLGQLTLDIGIPAGSGKRHSLEGRYEFLGGNMVLPIGDIPTRNMHGAIRFSDSGIREGAIRAIALGGPVEARILGARSRREPDTTFKLSGRMTPAGLSKEYGKWIDRYFNGSIPWSGEVSFQRGIPRVALQGDMRSVTNSLPSPVSQFVRSSTPLELRTTSSTEKRHVLRLGMGSQLSGVLDYHARGSGWNFIEGQMLVGGGLAALRGDRDLHLDFQDHSVNGDDWVDVVSAESGGDGIPMLVQGLRGKFDNVDFMNRDWGPASFSFRRTAKEQWAGSLTGQAIDGRVQLDTGVNGGRISMKLARLEMPKAREDLSGEKPEEEYDPRRFPTMEINAEKFSYDVMQLGRLDFSAEHTRIGWDIDRFQLTRPDMGLFAEGTWYRVAGDHIARSKLRFTSSNLGDTMTALGNPGQITGGTMNLDMNLNWRQDRKQKGLANLSGDVSLLAQNGRINKFKADGGSGPLSLFALSRYLSLDFSPALGKGLAFNEIKGKVLIQQGKARSDGLTLSAPVAVAVARGEIDLRKEKIDVHADIYPNLRGGVTVATGSLFGLQAAAWAYALQQLFSSEIEKSTRISYHVSGDLKKPKVTKTTTNAKKPKKKDKQQQ